MNRNRDFDQTLRQWLDDGAEQAPERFVWAALENVERTAQRGAWKALLERYLMKLKPAAPFFGIAAVVVLAFAAYQLFGSNVGGPTSPTPTPRIFTTADLPRIVLTAANAPDGMIVDATTTSFSALTAPQKPGGAVIPLTGFEDALMTNLNSTEAGGYVSWSAVYETAGEADRAYDFLITEHESAAGWDLEPSTPGPDLGDESAFYEGPAYAFETARIYLWRVNNLLLAAVTVGDVAIGDANAEQLRTIARGMDTRAR